jgi:hypothetical protein
MRRLNPALVITSVHNLEIAIVALFSARLLLPISTHSTVEIDQLLTV